MIRYSLGGMTTLWARPPIQPSASGDGASGWGAIAARLGKAKNRNAFAQSFWWDKLSQEQSGERSEEPVDGRRRSAASPTRGGRWSDCATNASGWHRRRTTCPACDAS
jgi:hypothetical protein